MTIEINTDDLTLYLVNLINRTVRKKNCNTKYNKYVKRCLSYQSPNAFLTRGSCEVNNSICNWSRNNPVLIICKIHYRVYIYCISIIFKIIIPLSFSILDNSPILCKCWGVDADNAIVSPIASWNPDKKKRQLSLDRLFSCNFKFIIESNK